MNTKSNMIVFIQKYVPFYLIHRMCSLTIPGLFNKTILLQVSAVWVSTFFYTSVFLFLFF